MYAPQKLLKQWNSVTWVVYVIHTCHLSRAFFNTSPWPLVARKKKRNNNFYMDHFNRNIEVITNAWFLQLVTSCNSHIIVYSTIAK